MGAYAGTGGAQTPASRPPTAPGRGGQGSGERPATVSAPRPCDPATARLETSPVGDSVETAPQGIQVPIPPGQPPPQVSLPAGLSLRSPPAPTAPAVGPEPALGKNPCEPGGFRNQVSLAWTGLSESGSLPGAQLHQPTGGGPGRGVEGKDVWWDMGRARQSTGSAPGPHAILPAVEATLQLPQAARQSAEQTLRPFNKRARDIFVKILMVLVNTTREHSGKSCFRSSQCHPVLLAN